MYIALLLLDSGKNAVQIFILCLHIFMLAGNYKFPCLKDVARLILVGNAHRDDVQFLEIVLEI